ncbi:unnamed protein product [Lathyrus oleraceus]
MWGQQGDGTWLRFNRLVWWLHHAGLPAPSHELTHGTCAKARVLWVLDRRVLREAGFTEQRTLPTPDSGGITDCVRLVSQSSEHFLLLTVEGSRAAVPPASTPG